MLVNFSNVQNIFIVCGHTDMCCGIDRLVVIMTDKQHLDLFNMLCSYFVDEKTTYFLSTSLAGAEANAIIYSVIETAKEHGLNIYKYFTYLVESLPNVEFLMKPKLLENFLSWIKKSSRTLSLRN